MDDIRRMNADFYVSLMLHVCWWTTLFSVKSVLLAKRDLTLANLCLLYSIIDFNAKWKAKEELLVTITTD